MSTYYIEEIEWETDGEDVTLPKEDIVELPDNTAEDDVYDALVEAMSDRHGWLVISLGYSVGRTFSIAPMSDLL